MTNYIEFFSDWDGAHVADYIKSRGYSYSTLMREFKRQEGFEDWYKSKVHLSKSEFPSYKEFFKDWDGNDIASFCSSKGVPYTTAMRKLKKQPGFTEWYRSFVPEQSPTGLISSKDLPAPSEWRKFFIKHFTHGYSLKQCILEQGFTDMRTYKHFQQDPTFVAYQSALQENVCQDHFQILLDNCSKLDITCLDDGWKSYSYNYHFKCNKCGHMWSSTVQNSTTPTICSHCKASDYRSKLERHFCTKLDELHISYQHNVRTGTHYERDIQIGSVAFELNGYYYHSTDSSESVTAKDSRYHKNKTEECLAQGISLYHLWYRNYETAPLDLMWSLILVKSGYAYKLPARKCELRDVAPSVASDFFKKYHVDGSPSITRAFGLFYNGSLVCCIGLNRRRIQSTKQCQWEIARFSTIYNTVVVGGYSRLLKRAISYLKSQGATELISYCNRDLSPDYTRTFYYKQGFKFLGDSGPCYWYYATRSIPEMGIVSGDKVPRQKLQGKNERARAEELGLLRCYNSGNWKFILGL